MTPDKAEFDRLVTLWERQCAETFRQWGELGDALLQAGLRLWE